MREDATYASEVERGPWEWTSVGLGRAHLIYEGPTQSIKARD
jgi:hypothetical protein